MSCENYDPCFPDQPVVDLYLPIWATQPAFRSKPAFIWADDNDSAQSTTAYSCITYSQLNSSAQSIANKLLFPLQRGDTLLVLCSPGLVLVKILFACQRAGLIAVPVVPPKTSSYHHLSRVINQTKPKAAIADDDRITSMAESYSEILWLSVECLDEDSHEMYRSDHYAGCRPHEPYLIQYTSGATGIPKPVVVTAGAAAHNVRAARRAYDLHPSSMIASWLPQYHDCGLMFLLLTVVSGATCVLTSPAAFLARPRLWLELISKFKATCTPVPSFTLRLVIKRGGIDKGNVPLRLESLQNLILINEPIYKSSVDQFIDEFKRVGLNPCSISPSYGLAENCTFVSTAWRRTSSSNMPAYNKLLPSARLSFDQEEDINIIIVNEETFEPVEDGVEGEIWVSSSSNALGYLGYPSLTREVFNARLIGVTGLRFMRTGDRGVIKGEDRYLYVTGRSSDVIIIDNHRKSIHSHYTETAAYRSNVEHLRGGCIAAFGLAKMVVVVAEMQKGGSDGGCFRRICEGIREGVMREEGVRVESVMLVKSGSLPKTSSGKLRRFLAKEMAARGRFQVVYEAQFEESVEDLKGNVGEIGVAGEGSALAGARHRLQLQSFM